jgi:hypothetical protein
VWRAKSGRKRQRGDKREPVSVVFFLLSIAGRNKRAEKFNKESRNHVIKVIRCENEGRDIAIRPVRVRCCVVVVERRAQVLGFWHRFCAGVEQILCQRTGWSHPMVEEKRRLWCDAMCSQ